MSNAISVLITRPDPAGSELCALIEAEGDHAIKFPTIDFAEPADRDAFQHAIAELGKQDWLIFVSPRAVYESVPTIRRQWPLLPETVKFAAVGAGTAKALYEAGYRAIYPEREWSSEGLLALPEFQSIDNQHIAIVRGEDGREHLANSLIARGAQVMHVIAYQRVLPKADITSVLALVKAHKIDAIVCTSFDGVRNLKTLFAADWPLFSAIPLIVVSERIKMLARDLNFQTIWVARNASHAAILELLAQKRNEICQINPMNR